MSKNKALRRLKRERLQALNNHRIERWWHDWDCLPPDVVSHALRRSVKRSLRGELVRP